MSSRERNKKAISVISHCRRTRPLEIQNSKPTTFSSFHCSAPPPRSVEQITKKFKTHKNMNSRKQKALDETTKMVILTPNSSVKSSLTVDSNPSETRGISYFPGCRKDANCKCEICIASITATLDLVAQSSNRSSFTNSYAPRTFVPRSPVHFNSLSAHPSTPKSSARSTGEAVSPPPGLDQRVTSQEKEHLGYRAFWLTTFWCLILAFGMEYGISWTVSRVERARLSTDLVKNLGLKSRDFESLNGRFAFLKNELEGLVGGDVSGCSSVDHSLWKINQDGQLLSSRCVLYKSTSEEVNIWGWPLQTAGLLAAECSTRSFTVITGRVREWSNGDADYLVRVADNSSWTQEKWSTSVVQFDPNTWILEYRRSFLIHNPKLVSAAVEYLGFRVTSQIKKMKKQFWLASAFGDQHSANRRGRIAAPT